jgi:hypothetical protein
MPVLYASPAPVVHSIAATGFQNQADVYEQVRPSYPAEAIDFIARQAKVDTTTTTTTSVLSPITRPSFQRPTSRWTTQRKAACGCST